MRAEAAPVLYVGQPLDAVALHAIGRGTVAAFSAGCPGREAFNEDAAALIPLDEGSAVLAVADGLGATPLGDHAASLAVRSLVRTLESPERERSRLRNAILDGIERASQAVAALGAGAGTTLTVAEIQEDVVRPYHVGDSLLLVVGQRGRIKFQSVAHSPVGFAVESGFLGEHEALHHEDRHLVSNVLGSREMRIEIGPPLHLAARDTLLLASDGLADNLRVREIAERMRRGPLAGCAQRLVADARRRMTSPAAGEPSKPDDLTLVLFRLSGGEPATTAAPIRESR
jgi:serine/threonine protein phosphatase PrpC